MATDMGRGAADSTKRKAADRQAAELGRTLKRSRREWGMTRSYLAGTAGVTEGTIRAIEEGRTKAPSLWVVTALARGLGVRASKLVPELETEAEILAEVALVSHAAKFPAESFMPGEVTLSLDPGQTPGYVRKPRRLTLRGQILDQRRGQVVVRSAHVTVGEGPWWDENPWWP